ncbi:MAG TPA: hypothetical protein VHZ75_04460 [Solirubrobacteraceae bacterium]|jgi:hypothetical protein|nr:hypothetical protein [Solirubrobacteraceae bacterium]
MAALVRAAQRADWSLDRLLKLGDKGFDMSISVLVDGRWIEGQLAMPERWADKLDGDIDAAIGAAAERTAAEQGPITDPSDVPAHTTTVGDLEEARARLRTYSFRGYVDQRRELEAEIESDLSSIDAGEAPPEDLQRKIEVLQEPSHVFTLRDVVIESGLPINNRHRPMLRVLTSQVSAWHIGRASKYEGPSS